MATCQELAEDRKAMDSLAQYYWTLEKSATPVSLLLPWFPGPAKKAKEQSTIALYTLFSHFVDLRRNASVPSTDPIDLLIAQGHSNETIIGVRTRPVLLNGCLINIERSPLDRLSWGSYSLELSTLV